MGDVSCSTTPLISGGWPAEGSLARLLATFNGKGRGAGIERRGPVRRVLHLLSQQPGKTGSGVYLQALVRESGAAGLLQRVIVGMPAAEPLPSLPPLEGPDIRAVRFGLPPLSFPVAGMSDVMPYESTRFSTFTRDMLESYLHAFFTVLSEEIDSFQPDLIHTHHLWLVTALARAGFPDIPVVTSCHGTELRQCELSPLLVPFVVPACAAVDRVMALHEEHAGKISTLYGIPRERIDVVGAGFRDDVFCPPGADFCPPKERDFVTIAYAGKISRAKGVHCLIEAMQKIDAPPGKQVKLLVAGSAGGEEGEEIRAMAAGIDAAIEFLGALPQERLAEVFKAADIFVLPSFYEGLPLVLLESIACCCRVVVTDLPGMDGWLPDEFSRSRLVERVPMPRLLGPDRPDPDMLPSFIEDLAAALNRQLHRSLTEEVRSEEMLCHLEPVRWQGIFRKVLEVYDRSRVR